MQYVSTRDESGTAHTFKQVVMKGLANDGGLFVPREVPQLDSATIAGWADLAYPDLCMEVMSHFISEEDVPKQALEKIIRKSYVNTFSDERVVPLEKLGADYDGICVLEQFHGPTCAFKDVALQFLGNLFEYFISEDGGTITVLGATSGDTGGAAIEGLRGKTGVQVCILHPEGKVAEIQRLQMCSVLDSNVHNVAVDGDFDDCQSMVKKLFNDQELRSKTHLAAVNSINFARILAQVVYYFTAYFQWIKLQGKELMKDKVNFVVPSGNFGNALAGYYAKMLGLPIGKFVIATNQNDILHRLIENSDYSRKESVASIAPAMDITVPSNFERYLFLLSGSCPTTLASWMKSITDDKVLTLSDELMAQLRTEFSSGRASNEEITTTVAAMEEQTGVTFCTHTAVGIHVALNYEGQNDLICFATAHHGKFGATIAESLKKKPAVPPQLACLEGKVNRCVSCPNDSEKLKAFLIQCVIEEPAADVAPAAPAAQTAAAEAQAHDEAQARAHYEAAHAYEMQTQFGVPSRSGMYGGYGGAAPSYLQGGAGYMGGYMGGYGGAGVNMHAPQYARHTVDYGAGANMHMPHWQGRYSGR